MAPAPSPNNIHEFRSSQSTHLVSASAPRTKAFLLCDPGAARNLDAVTVANKKPLQAAVKSKAIVSMLQPNSAATEGASPNMSSGEEVAQITTSISSAVTPAISRAWLAAWTCRSRNVSPCNKTCRLAMPVLDWIHSSLVSTTLSRSTFVTTVLGAAEPMPMGRQAMAPDFAPSAVVLVGVVLHCCCCRRCCCCGNDGDCCCCCHLCRLAGRCGRILNAWTTTANWARRITLLNLIFSSMFVCVAV
mmetsp:Transcript_14887/g.41137  ORF Transcript_14887/g.41137 Transcript_14887/m.41137 type:complete len:246 (-) Transcript_14887:159-896(-)